MPRVRRSSSLPTSRDEGSRRDCDVIAGRLYWLPAEADHESSLLKLSSIDGGCFAHPVVVLRVDNTKKSAEVFIVTSLRGKSVASYADRRRRTYLAIYPAEHPDKSNTLFLDDQILLQKKSYVTTQTQHTLSWKMLKPYRDRQSGQQFRLKADSYTELLKHANPSLLVMIPEGLASVPANSAPALYPLALRNPLAPLSANSARSYESDIERHAGLILPSRSEAQPRAQPYTGYGTSVRTPAAWDGETTSPSASYWRDARPYQQNLRGHSYSRQSSFTRSELLPYLCESANEPGDPQPVTTDSSWFTAPRCILAIFGVVVLMVSGYRYFSTDVTTIS